MREERKDAKSGGAVKAAYIGAFGLIGAALVTGGFGLFTKDAFAGAREDSDQASSQERIEYNERLLARLLKDMDADMETCRRVGLDASVWRTLKADLEVAFTNRATVLREGSGLALKLATRGRIRELLRRADRLRAGARLIVDPDAKAPATDRPYSSFVEAVSGTGRKAQYQDFAIK